MMNNLIIFCCLLRLCFFTPIVNHLVNEIITINTFFNYKKLMTTAIFAQFFTATFEISSFNRLHF